MITLATAIQSSTASTGARTSSAPISTLAPTNDAEPKPRGTEKTNPARFASLSVMTSLSGMIEPKHVAATNHSGAHSQKPCTSPVAA